MFSQLIAGTLIFLKLTIHTLDQLLEYCQVDLTIWEVERFVVNKWEVGAKEFCERTKS